MKDRILKWWNRKWSDWEFSHKESMYTEDGFRLYDIWLYKSKSNDGLVKIKKVKV